MLTPRQRTIFTNIYNDFLAEGFAAFTIDGAASRYKCSKATLYALGSSRNEVVRRVLIAYFQQAAHRTESVIQTSRTARQALTRYFAEIAAVTKPASTQFWQDMTKDAVAAEVYQVNTDAATKRITDLVRSGIASGEFRETNPEFAALVINATLERIQDGELPEDLPTPEAYAELGRFVLSGIAGPRV